MAAGTGNEIGSRQCFGFSKTVLDLRTETVSVNTDITTSDEAFSHNYRPDHLNGRPDTNICDLGAISD